MESRLTENIKLFALGGLGEIGKNMYIVEIDSDIFILDAGSKIPESEMFGIDIVIPDMTYLVENQDRIKGLFLTSGKDVQIGAIPYLVQKIKIPLYGTKLTLQLVRERLKEHGIHEYPLLKEIQSDEDVKIGNTEIHFFTTNQTIPDSVGFCFSTSEGAIIFTGGFTFDQTAVGGYSSTDIGKIANLSQNGVFCLLSDSTNAEYPGYTQSDDSVRKEIGKIFSSSTGRIILTVSETNSNRIQQVINESVANNRRIVLIGKKLAETIERFIKHNYIQANEELFIPITSISEISDEQVTILLTNHLSEPFKELTSMARQTHKHVAVKEGDTVVIASSQQPGKELTFYKTIDRLSRLGANVFSIYKKSVHIPGHGNQEELKLMLNITKPKFFIPVSGEYKMQNAHRKLAESIGLNRDNIFLLNNGDVVEYKSGQVKSSGKVQSGQTLIDGLGIGDIGNIVLRDRRLLSQDGILIVVVTLHKATKQIIAGPEIISRGFVYVRESEKLMEEVTQIVKKIINESNENQQLEWSTIKLNIRDSLNRFLYEKTKRRPMILPIIMEV